MPVYTVAKPGGTTNTEFQDYVELLEGTGIDVTDAPRVPEPGTDNRWLYVWGNRERADRFHRELVRRTGDRSWYVHSFEPVLDQRGPLTPLEILVLPSHDGSTFRLTQTAAIRISEHFPDARIVGEVFWSTQTRSDHEQQFGPIGNQVAILLTGLSEELINELGGYRFVDRFGRESPEFHADAGRHAII